MADNFADNHPRFETDEDAAVAGKPPPDRSEPPRAHEGSTAHDSSAVHPAGNQVIGSDATLRMSTPGETDTPGGYGGLHPERREPPQTLAQAVERPVDPAAPSK